MSNCDQQILALFDKEGLSPEEIAEALDYSVIAVKAVLEGRARRVGSNGYEGDDTEEDEVILTRADRKAFLYAMRDLALDPGEENKNAQARLLIYLNEEVTGRNAARVRKNNATPVNVLMINKYLTGAQKAIERAGGKRRELTDVVSNVIDVQEIEQ